MGGRGVAGNRGRLTGGRATPLGPSGLTGSQVLDREPLCVNGLRQRNGGCNDHQVSSSRRLHRDRLGHHPPSTSRLGGSRSSPLAQASVRLNAVFRRTVPPSGGPPRRLDSSFAGAVAPFYIFPAQHGHGSFMSAQQVHLSIGIAIIASLQHHISFAPPAV